MKTLSSWTIATPAALLLIIFAVPERAYAQQPCLSVFPTGPFTMNVTESAQFTAPSVYPGVAPTTYSEQGIGQATMPALSTLNGYLSSSTGQDTSPYQVTGTGSMLENTWASGEVAPFPILNLVDSAAGAILVYNSAGIAITINASNCAWNVY